jgi:hypothetical protein
MLDQNKMSSVEDQLSTAMRPKNNNKNAQATNLQDEEPTMMDRGAVMQCTLQKLRTSRFCGSN